MLTIELKVVFATPLHVGVGLDTPTAMARDFRGRPCLRASLLRGVHRAATEQIVAVLNLHVCGAPLADQMCQPLPGETPCTVCRIFGSPWQPGRLYFRDLLTTAAPVREAQVRSPQSRRRRVHLGTFEESRDELPPGTSFSGQIDHILTDQASLALALAGLRSITTMGAGNSTGYGLCRVEARALDSAKRPVDERDLAAALHTLDGRTRPLGQP